MKLKEAKEFLSFQLETKQNMRSELKRKEAKNKRNGRATDKVSLLSLRNKKKV
jgi:hypothetical protein